MDIIPVSYPDVRGTPRGITAITDFVVHHTAGALSQMPLDIDAEHRAIGDTMIAYNWVITPDGKVYAGRPVDLVSAATFGRNPMSVSAVLVGNFEQEDPGFNGPPTVLQVQSLIRLCVWAHKQYPTITETYGHRDVGRLFYPSDPDRAAKYGTACPGSELYSQLPKIKAAVWKALTAH